MCYMLDHTLPISDHTLPARYQTLLPTKVSIVVLAGVMEIRTVDLLWICVSVQIKKPLYLERGYAYTLRLHVGGVVLLTQHIA